MPESTQQSEEILAKLYPEKFCPGCEKTKPRDEFNRKKSNKTGLQTYCKSCQHVEMGVPVRKLSDQAMLLKIRCLSCNRMFRSKDKILNRICESCKARGVYGEDAWR